VTCQDDDFHRVVILADESANWVVGGLRQLERLVLALNEFAQACGYEDEIAALIFWEPTIPPAKQWLPDNSRFVRIRPKGLPDDSVAGEARVLTTHLFVVRNGLREFLQVASLPQVELPIVPSIESWRKLANQCELACPEAKGEVGWRTLERPGDVGPAQRQLLRRTGKTQDGLVSRLINRPISRSVTCLLLKFPVEPTTWTLSIFILPWLSCLFLVRGNYSGFVIGTVLYQLYSALDGCDGEIARAKYLDSKRGGQIDDLCDLFGAFVFVMGLGIGLSHSHWFYAAEGILLVLMIGTNEWLLRMPKGESNSETTALSESLYPRHRRLIRDSGIATRNEKLVAAFVRLTKRDVGILFFVLLALAGFPQWILHIWVIVTAIVLAVTTLARLRAAARFRPEIVRPDSHP
jgi:phosphatidylglycerophosphate synthase